MNLRAATLDDVAAISRVRDAVDRAAIGEPFMDEEDTRSQMTSPDLDLATDWVVACDEDGTIVGTGIVWPGDDVVFIDNGVHPDALGCGAGTLLLNWAEQRAREVSPTATIRTAVWLGQRSAEAFLEARAYRAVRFQQALAGTFEEPPGEPVWPDSVSVRAMDPATDERPLYEMHRSAYLDHWGDSEWDSFENFHHLLIEDEDFDPGLVFLAVVGERIVGDAVMLIGTTDNPDGAYLTDLAVLREERGRGIATALLHEAFREVHRRGYRRITSMVDSQSLTGADRIYERIGLRPTYGYSIYEREQA